jgi:biotin carboxyl carrier protein
LQYEFDIAGKRRHVIVDRSGDAFLVTVDGRPFHVSAVRIDARLLSLIVGSTSVEASVAPDGASARLDVRVGTTPVAVEVCGRRRPGQRAADAASGSGPQRIVAPMPGKIIRVIVKKGEAVAARQGLLVVEAMKMENELRAGRDGTIAELHVREGQSVEAGALLVVIQ